MTWETTTEGQMCVCVCFRGHGSDQPRTLSLIQTQRQQQIARQKEKSKHQIMQGSMWCQITICSAKISKVVTNSYLVCESCCDSGGNDATDCNSPAGQGSFAIISQVLCIACMHALLVRKRRQAATELPHSLHSTGYRGCGQHLRQC